MTSLSGHEVSRAGILGPRRTSNYIKLKVLMVVALLTQVANYEALGQTKDREVSLLPPGTNSPEIRVLKWMVGESSGEDDYSDEDGLHGRKNWDEIEEHSPMSDAIHLYGFGSHEYLVSQHVTAILFECRAPFPVQWAFHYAPFVSEDLHGIQMRTFRKSKSVMDPTSDVFTATLEISMESNRATGKYPCQGASSGRENISNDIFIYWQGTGSSPPYLVLSGKVVELQVAPRDRRIIIPCYVSSPEVEVKLYREVAGTGEFKEYQGSSQDTNKISSHFDQKTGFELIFQNISDVLGRYRCQTESEDDDNDLMEIVVRKGIGNRAPCTNRNGCFRKRVLPGARFYFDKDTEELVCCGRDNNKGLTKGFSSKTRLHTIFCPNPSVCSMYEPALLLSSGSNGKRIQNSSCVSERIYPRDFALTRCKGEGIDVFSCFYTEFWTPEQEHLQVAFDWKDVNPENMVHIMIHSHPPYYNRQMVSVTCQTLHSYFSDGIKWALRWINGSLLYFDAMEAPKSSTRRLHGIRSVQLKLDESMSEIICYAPVYNSTKWVEKRLGIRVNPSQSPKVKGTLVEELTFALNDTEKILECVSSANPPARVKWTRNDQDVPKNMIIFQDNGTSILRIPTVSYETQATYKCIAENEVGRTQKTFRILVEDTRRSSWSLAFAIVIPVVVLICLAIFGFMLWRMKQQGKVVAHLTRVVFRDPNNT